MKHANLQRIVYAKFLIFGEKNNPYCVSSTGDVLSTWFRNRGELSAYC